MAYIKLIRLIKCIYHRHTESLWHLLLVTMLAFYPISAKIQMILLETKYDRVTYTMAGVHRERHILSYIPYDLNLSLFS